MTTQRLVSILASSCASVHAHRHSHRAINAILREGFYMVLLKFLTATHLMQRLICVSGLCLCFGYCANVLLAAHGARFGGHSKPGGPGINMLIQSLSKHFKQSIPPNMNILPRASRNPYQKSSETRQCRGSSSESLATSPWPSSCLQWHLTQKPAEGAEGAEGAASAASDATMGLE